MRRVCFFLMFFLSMVISGCTRIIVVPDATIKSNNNVYIKSIIVIDNMISDSNLKTSFFGDIQDPIITDPSFFQVIKKDLTSFFNKSLGSEFNIVAHIQRADPYLTRTVEQRIPIIGLFLLNEEVEYGLYLRIHFEIEQNGKVIKTYLYDNLIKTMAENASPSDVKKGYLKLVSTYRQEFFKQLDSEFLARYF